jgi:hypothetical protein
MPSREGDVMPEPLDKQTVLRLLGELDRRDWRRRAFGAAFHQYKLNPPLPLSVVEAFEQRDGVSLPEDYRYFVTETGNGGAGPSYGVLPFGKDVMTVTGKAAVWSATPRSRSRTRPPGTCPSRSGTASPTLLPARSRRRRTG